MTDEQRKALTLYLGEPWTLSYNEKISRSAAIGWIDWLCFFIKKEGK